MKTWVRLPNLVHLLIIPGLVQYVCEVIVDQLKIHLNDRPCRVWLSFWRMYLFLRDTILVHDLMVNVDKRRLRVCTLNHIHQDDNRTRQIVSCR